VNNNDKLILGDNSMKKQSTQIRYGLAMLVLCCMQSNPAYSMQSSPASSYAARLYTVLQDRRTWGATAAALLFLGTAAWYLWSKPKLPTHQFKELTLPEGFDAGVAETITAEQITQCFRRHQEAVKLINSILKNAPAVELDQYIHRIVIILSKQDTELSDQLREWFNQFKVIFPKKKAEIQLLITELMNITPKTVPPTSRSQQPPQPVSSSAASPSTSSAAAPAKPTPAPQALTELAPIPTQLMPFPAVPQPSSAAPGQSPQYLTTRGFSEDDVTKILNHSNIAVSLIDEILSTRDLTTLSARVKDVYVIVNYGEQTHVGALENWLNQFKAFFEKQNHKEAIKNLIEDLKNIEKSSKSA